MGGLTACTYPVPLDESLIRDETAQQISKRHARELATTFGLHPRRASCGDSFNWDPGRSAVPSPGRRNGSHQIRRVRLATPAASYCLRSGTGKLFICPADTEQQYLLKEHEWSWDRWHQGSYFGACDGGRGAIVGDRNILLIQAGRVPVVLTGTNRVFRTNTLGWGPDIHHRKGNLLLADGSVHITNDSTLNGQIAAQRHPFFDWFIPTGP